MHEVIKIMHVCYTALHYKLKTQDIMKIKDILKVFVMTKIYKLCWWAAKITHILTQEKCTQKFCHLISTIQRSPPLTPAHLHISHYCPKKASSWTSQLPLSAVQAPSFPLLSVVVTAKNSPLPTHN
jgi:hypothetical protein